MNWSKGSICRDKKKNLEISFSQIYEKVKIDYNS